MRLFVLAWTVLVRSFSLKLRTLSVLIFLIAGMTSVHAQSNLSNSIAISNLELRRHDGCFSVSAKNERDRWNWYRITASTGFTPTQIIRLEKAATAGKLIALQLLGEMYLCGHGVEAEAVTARKYFSQAAEKGASFAQRRLGAMFAMGEGGHHDDAAAFTWFQKAANQGDTAAKVAVAKMYDLGRAGRGDTKSLREAESWYRNAAQDGNMEAKEWLQQYEKTIAQEASNPLLKLIREAEEDNTRSQIKLARHYELGDGVKKDEQKAFYWYQKAAENSRFYDAQMELARCYANGIGTQKDDVVAGQMFRRLADIGMPNAHYELGKRLLQGIGMSKRADEAVKWLEKAALNRHPDSAFLLAKTYETSDGVAYNESMVRGWYERAAKYGSSEAQFKLASMFENGELLPKVTFYAYAWYLQAAYQGLSAAIEPRDRLGKTLTDSDRVNASQWVEQQLSKR